MTGAIQLLSNWLQNKHELARLDIERERIRLQAEGGFRAIEAHKQIRLQELQYQQERFLAALAIEVKRIDRACANDQTRRDMLQYLMRAISEDPNPEVRRSAMLLADKVVGDLGRDLQQTGERWYTLLASLTGNGGTPGYLDPGAE